MVCYDVIHRIPPPLPLREPIEPMRLPGKVQVPLVPETHFLHHTLRGHIRWQCPRRDFRQSQVPEAKFQADLGNFGGEALVPRVAQDSGTI